MKQFREIPFIISKCLGLSQNDHYVFDVLHAEAIIKLIQDSENISREEAEEKMMTAPSSTFGEILSSKRNFKLASKI